MLVSATWLYRAGWNVLRGAMASARGFGLILRPSDDANTVREATMYQHLTRLEIVCIPPAPPLPARCIATPPIAVSALLPPDAAAAFTFEPLTFFI